MKLARSYVELTASFRRNLEPKEQAECDHHVLSEIPPNTGILSFTSIPTNSPLHQQPPHHNHHHHTTITIMPLTFRCQKEPPPDLPPIPIPGMDSIMSNDGVAKVFNLDPRLQDGKLIKKHNMAPREGGFLDSLRASFSGKSIKNGSRMTPPQKRQEKGKERERQKERDLSFVVLPRSASSLIPGKTSVPLPPMPKREDRLPRHANIFTGVPTPTDSTVTSARNSQHVASKPGTPVHEHPLRSSRSVPDWTAEQRKQYCYFQDASENELPRMPSTYEPQAILNPRMSAGEVGTLEKSAKGGDISRESSPKPASIGRYKRKQVASKQTADEAFCQQRSSMKPQKPAHLVGKTGVKRNEFSSSFLSKDGPGSGNSIPPIPARKQSQQQPNQSPTPPPSLPSKQIQVRRRSSADDQKPTLSTSHRLPDRPTSISTYQAHRGHALCPVIEEALQPVHVTNWSSSWSPHLQQESELFFKTGTGKVALEQVPVKMRIPSPRHKHKTRPASWACPTRQTVGTSPRQMGRNEYELDFMFPPTPPSSTGDACDDHNDADGERRIFWNRMRNSWNVFVIVWALVLVFKIAQFLVRFVDFVIVEPGKLLCDALRNVTEG